MIVEIYRESTGHTLTDSTPIELVAYDSFNEDTVFDNTPACNTLYEAQYDAGSNTIYYIAINSTNTLTEILGMDVTDFMETAGTSGIKPTKHPGTLAQ